MTEQEISKLKEEMRALVLDALDTFANEYLPMNVNAKGWKDSDLPALFKGIDSHFETLTTRYKLTD